MTKPRFEVVVALPPKNSLGAYTKIKHVVLAANEEAAAERVASAYRHRPEVQIATITRLGA